MRKYKLYIIVSIIILFIFIIGSTFAFFKWTADKEALVNVTVSSGTGKCELKDDNEIEMFPTYSKYHGRKIKLNAKQEMSEKAYITWNMVINEINGLQDKTFMYELVNNTTGLSYGSGTFENVTSGTTITFSNNEEVLGYNREYEFTLYLWIDGTLGNNSISMSNQVFDFDINCNITGTDEGIVEEQYTLMSVTTAQSSTSKFLRSELTREQIESITFVNDVEIPEDAIDVSQNKDDSVMMWYTNDNGDNLFDVYIGVDGGVISLSSGYYLFSFLINVESLDLSGLNTSKVTDMIGMFGGSTNLASLDLSDFDTSNVTSMGGKDSGINGMFEGCSSLTTLDLSNFDTSKVTDMSSMFEDCSNLTTVNLSSFNTSNVTIMSSANWAGMFEGCKSLITLDLSSFDTSKVDTMSRMFIECSSLKNIIFGRKFNTLNVTSMENMFNGCSSLTTLDLSSFNTSNVKSMRGMFGGCKSLTTLDISSFDTSNVTTMGDTTSGINGMFEGCSSLTTLDLSHFNTSKVTNMASMFEDCSSLTTLDVSSFDTSSVMYMGPTSSGWIWGGMFEGCKSMTTLDLSSFDISNVVYMNRMFTECSSLESIIFGKSFNTSNVKFMNYMFNGCSSLTSLDISEWNTQSVTNMGYMFNGCSSLTSLDISEWNTQSVTSMANMFNGCSKLISLDISEWNTQSVTTTNSMFNGCTSLTSLDLSKWEAPRLTDITMMFYACGSLVSLDIRNADFSKSTNYSYMFYNIPNGATIYVKDDTQKTWITSKFTNLTGVKVPTI